jgi:hypothetical protein
MKRQIAAIVLLLALTACSGGAPDDDGASVADLPASSAPLKHLHWRALVAAGDDVAPVFDNGVDRMRDILAADGVGPIDRFTSDPELAAADRLIATADNFADALAKAPPKPGEGCFVFVTSHGSRRGLMMRGDLDRGRTFDPSTLGRILDQGCGKAPTVAIVSGCFSGIFIGRVTTAPNRIILTAARDDRTSFGCSAEETYTYFDDCVFQSWPGSRTFVDLYRATTACVLRKENALGAVHSEPQAFFGKAVANLALP